MIKINNREYEWKEGQTFSQLQEAFKENGELEVILKGHYMLMINGRYISPDERDKLIIVDKDTLLLLPSATGG